MLALAWKLDDLSFLSKNGRALLVEVRAKTEEIEHSLVNGVTLNVTQKLTVLQERLASFIQGTIMVSVLKIKILPCM